MPRIKPSEDITLLEEDDGLTIKSREDGMISLALALAEKKLRDGTASPQIITHFLKLGTTQQQLEIEKLEKETELLRAKTEALRAQRSLEETYKEAIAAMRIYQGNMGTDDEDPHIFRDQ